jgi:simple sugar transport system ATP-binding protein
VEETTLKGGSPREAIAAGIGLSPEDRKAEGLFLSMTIRDNIAMVAQRGLGWRGKWGLVSRREHERLADRFVGQLGIAAASRGSAAGTLSGGNQQKVLLARWLANCPRVLILDEPTRGVDVGGKAQIEELVRELSRGESRMAILFVSAELEEVARRCDRVLVLRDREVVGELRGAEVTESAIMRMVAE